MKVFTFVIIFLFIAVITWVIYFYHKKDSLISPVLGNSKQKIAESIWYPKESNELFIDAPKITAQAAFFIEVNTGEVLYQKNHLEKLPIASLTKIMTAIITLESRKLDESILVSKKAALTEPDKMYLVAGERLTIKELLEGIFLVSANDAAEALAEGVTGRREEFINLMNSKAASLGMFSSKFINPSGLEEDGQTESSSALDVAVMSRFAIKNFPELLAISSQPHILIASNNYHQDYDLYSGINLLTSYPGVLGFKTGFTPTAGLTLVTFAKKGDKEVLGVLLNSTERRDDAKDLLDYSFKKLEI